MLKSKILIVDDSEDIRALTQKIFDDKYILEMATNGEEALIKALEFKPDLIILDIILPKTSGYEVCSQLKSREELEDIPIIILSFKTGSSNRIKGYKHGAIQYIEKPFEAEELKEVVKSVLKNVSKADKNEVQIFQDITLDIPSQEVLIIGKKIHFTSTEFKVIHLLLKNINRVQSREKILNHITPGNFTASDRIIDTYISALRKKIKVSKFEIKSIYGEGYKITEKDNDT